MIWFFAGLFAGILVVGFFAILLFKEFILEFGGVIFDIETNDDGVFYVYDKMTSSFITQGSTITEIVDNYRKHVNIHETIYFTAKNLEEIKLI